jgi:hypothetical protein
MKKCIILAVLIMVTSVALSTLIHAKVTNKDVPAKGTWDFKLKKIWEAEDAGGEVFAEISRITVNHKDDVYVVDSKNFKVFIFDTNGKYVSAFGKKGEGPGEMRVLDSSFLVGNRIAFADYKLNRIHYFKLNGDYINSIVVPNELSVRYMIDENRLISVPYINWRDPKAKATGFIYNIKEKSKKKLFEFSSFKDGMAQEKNDSGTSSYSFSDSSITPVMVLGYSNGKVFYGMNDRYEITVMDVASMKQEVFFSLDRDKSKVPPGYKQGLMKHLDWPENIKNKIRKGFPDELTYFHNIFSDHHHNIYVFLNDPSHPNHLKFDIFSPEGKYLYAAQVTLEEGKEIARYHFTKTHLYLGIENEDGEITLSKYRMSLPGQ